jgi:hypothetical protein
MNCSLRICQLGGLHEFISKGIIDAIAAGVVDVIAAVAGDDISVNNAIVVVIHF